jgi:myosin I
VAKQTRRWAGPTDQAIKLIMQAVNIDQDQYQLGKTKIFIKAPESLSLLEELRDRKYNEHALVLQKAFRKHNAVQYFLKLKNEAADLMYQKKERRSLSVNRKFYGDYIGLDNKPALRALINKREQIEFAQTCIKYNRQFKKQKRDFILTNKAFYIIGREEEEGKNAGGIFNKFNRNNNKKLIETIKRRIDYNSVEKIVLSHLQDNFLILYPQNDYANVLEVEFKTEFLTTFSKRYKEAFGKPLVIEFNDEIAYKIKKEGFMGGGERKLQFVKDQMCKEVQIKSSVKSCEIRVSPGLPNTTRPSVTYYQKYNFESESWWPKFNKLREKYNIQIVKGDKKQKSNQKNQSITNNNNNNNNKSNNNQSLIKPPIKARRPVPPPIEPQLPKCKALYPYSASDSDELSFQEGEIIYIVSEDSSGWWNGKLITGKTGLFPSNYIEKI